MGEGLEGFSPEMIDKATEAAPASYTARPGDESDRVERAVGPESLVGKDDRKIFDETGKELGEKFSPGHRQTLVELIHSQEQPGRNFKSSVVDHLAVHVDQIRHAVPERQREEMKAITRGFVGERLSELFSLRDPRVKTPVNIDALWTLTDQFKVEMSSVNGQVGISRQLDFINRVAAEALVASSEASLFAPGVTPENVSRLGRPLILSEAGEIVPNPAIYNRENSDLVEAHLEHSRRNVPDKLLRDNRSHLTVGFLEVKAYSPEEVRQMVKAGAENQNPDEIGGRVGDKNLVIRLGGERRFVEEMVDPRELSAKTLVGVVRFLEDSPLDAVKVLEHQALRKGLGPVAFQTLPFTNEELSLLVEKTLDRIPLSEVEARAKAFAVGRENRLARSEGAGK